LRKLLLEPLNRKSPFWSLRLTHGVLVSEHSNLLNRFLNWNGLQPLGPDPDIDLGTFAGTHHHGGGGFRTGLHQCSVGGFRDRGNGRVGQRDQPSGADLRQHRQRGGGAGAQDQ
jgi:hypothetical protein